MIVAKQVGGYKTDLSTWKALVTFSSVFRYHKLASLNIRCSPASLELSAVECYCVPSVQPECHQSGDTRENYVYRSKTVLAAAKPQQSSATLK